ncbi:hypothetical protein ACLB2K_065037 [Fragaria x ananassa]
MEMALLAVFLISAAACSSVTEAAKAYDYFQFVQQYPITLCMFDISCIPGQSLPRYFYIHGLWPSNFSYPHNDCVGTLFDYNQMSSDRTLSNDVLQSWPSFTSKSHIKFWADEYDKHGTCSEIDYPQHRYFAEAHMLWTFVNAYRILATYNIVPGRTYPAVDIIYFVQAALKGITPSVMCKADSAGQEYLHEIIICLDKTLTRFINCVRPSTCRGTAVTYP